METLIVGGRGLVGSALCRRLERSGRPFETIGREGLAAPAGRRCKLLVLCCGNAHKGQANAHPAEDFAASVASVTHYVHSIQAERTLLISTVDVYNHPDSSATTGETEAIEPLELAPYGFHKRLAELNVLRFCARPLVLRVPALVGPGLRKNPIFDHLAANRPLFVHPDSRLNVLHTDDLAQHTLDLIAAGVEGIVNIAATDTLRVADLEGLSGRPCRFLPEAAANLQRYEICVGRARQWLRLVSSREAVEHYAGALLAAPLSAQVDPAMTPRVPERCDQELR